MDNQLTQALQAVKDTQALLKASNITTTSVTNLVREDLEQEVKVALSTETPLRNRLPRTPGYGDAHEFFRVEPTSTSGIKSLGTLFANMVVADGAIPTTVADATMKKIVQTYKNIADKYSFTYQESAAGRNFEDVNTRKRKTKISNVMLAEEYYIINGDVDNSAYEFDGLKKQITQTLDYASFTPTTADLKLMEAIQNCCKTIFDNGGRARAVVLPSGAMVRLIKEIWIKAQIDLGISATEAAGRVGFQLKSYDFGFGECDLIVSRYIPYYSYSGSSAWDIYVVDDKTVDSQNDGTAIQVVERIPISEVKLGLTALSENTVVFENVLLQIGCPTFQVEINNYQ